MRILRVKKRGLTKLIKEVTKSVKSGQVVICPTDTVYGLVCDAGNKKAVRRLSQIKKRPKGKPIPIFVKDIKMAKRFAEIDGKQEKFLRKVWPGAVTAVLRSKKGKDTIGIRVPDHRLILNLIKKLNRPFAETSVNISGRPPARNIKEILSQFSENAYNWSQNFSWDKSADHFLDKIAEWFPELKTEL